MSSTSSTGKLGEDIATDYLKNKGYVILDRNWKNNVGRRLGEIDIVAKDPENSELVFVEVKTRDSWSYGDTLPEENITHSKLRKLAKIASAYLYSKNLTEATYRFDAVSVWLNEDNQAAEIKHLPSIYL
jgi:putative endonuclease